MQRIVGLLVRSERGVLQQNGKLFLREPLDAKDFCFCAYPFGYNEPSINLGKTIRCACPIRFSRPASLSSFCQRWVFSRLWRRHFWPPAAPSFSPPSSIPPFP